MQAQIIGGITHNYMSHAPMNTQLEQKTLHFVVYNSGNAGMCNLFLSIQNALIIATLTGREHIIFYTNDKLYNSAKGLSIFDLFDIEYSYSVKPSAEYPTVLVQLPSFILSCFYHTDSPSRAFTNGREAFDLAELWDINAFGTDKMTLGYYSYLFFLSEDLRDDIVLFIKDAIQAKPCYLNLAQGAQPVGPYQSLHFRRGDYLTVPGTQNAHVTWDDLMPNLSSLDKNVVSFIHTDETDESYFQPMLDAGFTLRFIEKELSSELDEVEKGLVSLLVATAAKEFIGTMLSTYSGFIHQYRRQRGNYSGFKFLYSQFATIKLKDGEISRSFNGEYSWNRLHLNGDVKNTLNWMMEHPECYPNFDLNIDDSIKIYPNFLSEEEINYFTSLIEAKTIEHIAFENRDRAVIYMDQDEVLKQVVQRITSTPAMQSETFENGMQLFKQYKGGDTGLHCDSLASNTGELRYNSALLYLNEDYAGGCLEFPYLHTRISPTKGMMVSYPVVNKYGEQMQKYAHSSSVVTKGFKLVCYLASRR